MRMTYLNKNFLGVLILVFCVLSCHQKTNREAETRDTNDLPQMTLMVKDRGLTSAKDLKENTILIFFQPDCDHCQREAKDISEHLEHFSNYNIYFTSTDSFEAIDQFAIAYDLSGKPNVYFAQTTLDAILNSVGQISAPSMFIYTDQKLVKHLDGETPITEILKYL